MRVPSVIARSDVGINLTPMIDVTFQLIIFFLISSHLSKQEAQMDLPLPVAASGEQPTETSERRLTLNVLGDGSLILAGDRIGVERLPSRLNEVMRQENAGLEVRIRGDRSVRYEFIEPVLTACARAGLWNVKFSVFRPEDVK